MNDAKFEIEIDELEDVLEEELHLYENTSLEYAAEFLESFLKYLKHNRTTGIGGRTPGTLRSNLRDFKDFAFSHGFKMEEIYVILRRFPGILNTSLDNLEQKYKLMALAEDETGTLEKENCYLHQMILKLVMIWFMQDICSWQSLVIVQLHGVI